MRFEVFLNGTNQKATEAIKKAEEETRRKQEKNNEIKRLAQRTEATSADLTKLRCLIHLTLCIVVVIDNILNIGMHIYCKR